jgi:hypothetical protein
LQFNYDVIQLNRLNWRDFVRNPNPVAWNRFSCLVATGFRAVKHRRMI